MECTAQELSSDQYERMYAKNWVLNRQFGRNFWCQTDKKGYRHCGDTFPVRWSDYATEVARSAEAFLHAHRETRVQEAVKTLTAYQYYLYRMPLLMAQMTGHFYSEGVKVYGKRPSLYISDREDHIYVALYFEYILGADRWCQKTYQIPQFQEDSHHITLVSGGSALSDIHLETFLTLRSQLEKKNRSNEWLPIAPWQKPSPFNIERPLLNQFYFMGSELIKNLSRYAEMDKKKLREVLEGEQVYHISL